MRFGFLRVIYRMLFYYRGTTRVLYGIQYTYSTRKGRTTVSVPGCGYDGMVQGNPNFFPILVQGDAVQGIGSN